MNNSVTLPNKDSGYVQDILYRRGKVVLTNSLPHRKDASSVIKSYLKFSHVGKAKKSFVHLPKRNGKRY